MTFARLRDYYIALPGAEEGVPFGDGALVLKVGARMFALLTIETIPTAGLREEITSRAAAER